MKLRLIVGAACAALIPAFAMTVAAHTGREVVTPHFEHALPDIPGKSLIAVVVDYPPGSASAPHSHAKSAFIFGYVVSGAIETQVNDEARRIVRAGESFYEPPGSRHPVSRNASTTEPAKLLAVFVVDSNDRALTTPDK
ncbi:cupin domain-containing protein [Variovorax sp. RA8]|uniref:cupin domain-containing protein n=1 Tax=Variovorax sp. (strain JCM 16519 / RA8) TaxID=662548 RepID=UPI000A813AB6|nr:cupin domain-containing protein [Variovorax sp. RA8]VTU22135.1 putative mannose-6-phosphate isomerase [Variovorax sp. RA8]